MPTAHPPVVTISAAYGAGGSIVGPAVAERLGVAFVDRAIPATVSERLAVPLEEALARDESPPGLLERLLANTAATAQMMAGAPVPAEALGPEDAYRAATERVLREHAASGAVILGRAAAIVLRDIPHALHVRLDGAAEERAVQAARLGELDRDEALAQLRAADRARESYVRFYYRADARDLRHYHLVLDSTALGLDACVVLVAAAARARRAAAVGAP